MGSKVNIESSKKLLVSANPNPPQPLSKVVLFADAMEQNKIKISLRAVRGGHKQRMQI